MQNTPDAVFDSRLPPGTHRHLSRLHARAWGWAAGLFLGFALFLATLILVFRGGENVGAHLGLLAIFFPGYSVTVVGAFVGLVYAFVVGYALGRLVGVVYNYFVRAP